MTRSARQRKLYAMSIVLAAAPFAFALIRAVKSGYDLRMLWMAFAAFAGATAVMLVGRVRQRGPRGVLGLSVLALAAATLAAGWLAYRLGAKAAAGVWPVAFVLGFCCAGSYALETLSARAE